jgi:Flp pilus assembly protein TadG
MMTKRRLFGARKGNAIIETALCFLLFTTIFLGIMEFGWGIFNYNFVSYAAREGARYASTRGSQCQSPCSQATSNVVRDVIRGQSVAMDTSQISVTTVYDPDNKPGNTVTVNVSYPIPPLLGWLMGNITVTASSKMRIAQ